MSVHAFIFARGGSKGLPRKNLMRLAGKPLVQHAIETAQKVSLCAEVFVSTDDDEIAAVARAARARVIERPAALAADDAPEWLAWRHAIEWVTTNHGAFGEFVSVPPTSPLRTAQDVEAAIMRRRDQDADVCITVTPSSRNPYFNMVRMAPDGWVSLLAPTDTPVVRRQDAPAAFDITTLAYVTTPRFVLGHNGLFEGRVTAITVPRERAVDIDDLVDFRLAEVLMKERQSHDASKP